jgi:hypothetical protein
MKRTDTFQIENGTKAGQMSAAVRRIRSLMGVTWGDINSTATELTVTYDDLLITRSGIASNLKSMAVICIIFFAPTKSSSIECHSESRAVQKINFHKQGYRCHILYSPDAVCGCY